MNAKLELINVLIDVKTSLPKTDDILVPVRLVTRCVGTVVTVKILTSALGK